MTEPFLTALEPVRVHYLWSAERERSLILLKAIRLCPTLDLCERYLRGERLPVSLLDQGWAKAYGLLQK